MTVDVSYELPYFVTGIEIRLTDAQCQSVKEKCSSLSLSHSHTFDVKFRAEALQTSVVQHFKQLEAAQGD